MRLWPARSWIVRTLLSAAVSIVILALLIAMAGRSGQSVNLASLTTVLRNISVGLLLVYLVLQLIGAVFRAVGLKQQRSAAIARIAV